MDGRRRDGDDDRARRDSRQGTACGFRGTSRSPPSLLFTQGHTVPHGAGVHEQRAPALGTAMTKRSWRRGVLGIVVGFALTGGLAYTLLELLGGVP